MRSLTTVLVMSATLTSNAALASCWGQGEKVEEIMRQEFQLTSNAGPVRAVTSYQVHARGEVCEVSELTLGVLRRTCEARPYARKFLRSITIYPRDGGPFELGRTEKLVATASTISEVGPCTDHAASLTARFYTSQIGTANSWANEINEDLKDVQRTLELIGKIDSTTITLRK